MVVFNYSGREINAKIVYYGPGLSGKTTNLERIYGQVPEQRRGKMVSMKTRSDRTLFFDFLPVSGGEIKGFRTRYLLYTVPGQVHYNATRKLVLKGTDAIIFVADSDPVLRDANIESMANLEENLAEYGLSTEKIPIIIQYNKRDVPNPMSIEQLNADINPRGWPWFEGVAIEDKGVWETFRAAVDALFKTLEETLGGDESSSKSKSEASQEDQAEPALVAPPETEGGITLSGDVTHGDANEPAGAGSTDADSSYNVDESIKGDAPVKMSDPAEINQPAAEHQQEAASAADEQSSPSRGTQNGQNLDWRETYVPPGAKQRTQASTATESPPATQEPASYTEPEPQETVASGSPEVGYVDQSPPVAEATASASATDGVVHVPVKVETEHGVLRLEISINLQLKEGAEAAVVDSGGDWK